MKALLFLLVIFFSTSNLKAQVYNQSEYDTCSYYNQFVGEWRYVNGNDTVRFYFKVLRYISEGIGDYDFKLYRDDLIGWHEYKQGNNIIESNYQNRFLPLSSCILYAPPLKYSIDLNFWKEYGSCNSSSRILIGEFVDISRMGQWCQAKVEINPAITEMHFLHWPHAPCKVQPCGTTLPAEMTLIKQ